MRCSLMSVVVSGMVCACLAGPGMVRRGNAQDEPKIIWSSRGGMLTTVEGHRFEVFFYPTGVRVFPMDETGKPMDVRRLSGQATFFHPNDPDTPWFVRPLRPTEPRPDHPARSLDLSIGLASVPRQGATVQFEILGLESPNASTADFRIPLRFVADPQGRREEAVRLRLDETATIAESSPRVVVARTTFASSPTPRPAVAPLIFVLPTIVPVTETIEDFSSFGTRNRDWSTGRTNLPLSRPWLYPRGLNE